MALNLAHYGMPARIQGIAAGAVMLRERRTGETVRLGEGRFNQLIPAGRYSASCNGFEWDLDLVDGRHYRLSFESKHAIVMHLSATYGEGGIIQLAIQVRGQGRHTVALRLFNCVTASLTQRANLKPGVSSTLDWQRRVADSLKPWIVVAIPDSQLDQRQELFGDNGHAAEVT